MCVAGGFNQLDKANYFIPVGLSPVEIRKEQKGSEQLVGYEEYSVLVLVLVNLKQDDDITMARQIQQNLK